MRRKHIYRPPPPRKLNDTLYTTAESLQRKYEYLSHLQERLASAKEDKKVSHAEGDLKENMGFKAAKQDIARYSMQIEQLQNLFSRHNFEPVSPQTWAENSPICVCLGAEVTFKRQSMPAPETYIICGYFDCDFKTDELSNGNTSQLVDNLMSYTSPLISQLMGKEPGESTDVELGDNRDHIQILKVAAPSLEKIRRIYNMATPEIEHEADLMNGP